MSHLEQLRAYELEEIVRELPSGARLLEIGAGTGQQARTLAQRGFTVEAVDLASSEYAHVRVWPVRDYDGRHLPFPDASFDAVFSSNVLEHVRHIEELQAEIHRVLRPGGRAVHALPTPAWRLWTDVSHYLFAFKFAALLLWPRPQDADSVAGRDLRRRDDRKREPWTSITWRVLRIAVPRVHGVRGNASTEMYWFSRSYWLGLFRQTGWNVTRCRRLHLFYTGHAILGPSLSIATRHRLSFALGSANWIYVMQPSAAPTDAKIPVDPIHSQA